MLLVSLSLLFNVAFVVAVGVTVTVAVAGAVFVASIRCFSFFGLFLLLYFCRHFNVITVTVVPEKKDLKRIFV